MHALRKRKPQATQALMIGCLGDWLLRSTIAIGWRLRSLREKSYAMFFFACVIKFSCVYCVSCALFILLAYFFLRKTLRALRAFEWKPGLSHGRRRRHHGDRGTRKSERTHKNSNPVLDDSITACNAVSVCMMQFSFPALNVSAR